MMDKISIVLVNYCGASDTVACVNSIMKANGGRYFIDIIIVDNNSLQNGVWEILYKLELINEQDSLPDSDMIIPFEYEYGHLIFIKSKVNKGFGFGNNLGIRYVKEHNMDGDICILLNNDTIVSQSFFERIDEFIKNKEYKCAFSVLSRCYFNPNQIDSEGFGYIDLYTGRSSHQEHYKCRYLVGSCIIMNDIKSIPYFDENFFLYSEDVDYSFLLSESGYRLEYDSCNFFMHKVNASTSINPNMEKIKMKSLIYLIKKRGTFIQFMSFWLLRNIYYFLHFRFSYCSSFNKYVWSMQRQR